MFNFSHGSVNILSVLTQNGLLVILFRNDPGDFPGEVVAVGTKSSHHNFHKVDLFGEILLRLKQIFQEIILEQKLTALKNFDEAFFQAQFIYFLLFLDTIFINWLLQAHLLGVASDWRRHWCPSLRE